MSLVVPNDAELFNKFSKHIPKVLVKQLVANISKRYFHRNRDPELNKPPLSFGATPSIERFHGSLLFVDISGFTVLSQRLNVDDLRLHINSYFEKILNIVAKYGGDVVKFAGDALFIVWMTAIQDRDDAQFKKSSAEAVQSAVSCGLEINTECSEYEISLLNVTEEPAVAFAPDDESKSRAVSQSSKDVLEKLILSPSIPSVAPPAVTYLNVHAGVSVGVMASIDVGSNDRWEYLLKGSCLGEVAVAESRAEKGELVISPEATSLLHGVPLSALEGMSHSPGACLCIHMKDGYCRMLCRASYHVKDPSSGNISSEDEQEKESAQVVVSSRSSAYGLTAACVGNLFALNRHQLSIEFAAESDFFHKKLDENLTLSPVQPSLPHKSEAIHGARTQLADELILDHFVNTIEKCLVDDAARHVHEAERSTFMFHNVIRTNAAGIYMQQFDSDQFINSSSRSSYTLVNRDSFAGNFRQNVAGSSASYEEADSFIAKMKRAASYKVKRNSIHKKHAKHERLLNRDRTLSAELRNVIVLFISVELPPSELFFEDKVSGTVEAVAPPSDIAKQHNSDYFLARSDAEISADTLILSQFQACMELLTSVLTDTGGQLRQFIVDDKGTVAIATFGLRGSINNDNAAAAMEAAQLIVFGLQDIGFNASVGVTSGKVYCGLVGSERRHEYAVMGPSTNLSARLMGKAKMGEVICDAAIRDRDRTHKFKSLGEIMAKGYTKPVAIFKPLLNYKMSVINMHAGNMDTTESGSASPAKCDLTLGALGELPDFTKQLAVQLNAKTGHIALRGRDQEISDAVEFALPQIFAESLKKVNLGSFASVHTPTTPGLYNSRKYMMDTDDKVRTVAIIGANGLGKSAVLEQVRSILKTHLHRKLNAAEKLTRNFAVFSSPSNVTVSLDPFSAWKYAVRSMLAELCKFSIQHGGNTQGRDPEQKNIKKNDMATYYQDLNAGFDFILPALRHDLRDFRFLLEAVHILRPREGDVKHSDCGKLEGTAKQDKTVLLVAAIIQQYVTTLDKVAIFFVEDLDTIDTQSTKVFQKICESNTGVVFFLTMRPQIDSAKHICETGSSESNSSCVDILNAIALGQEASFKSISLNILSPLSTRQILEDMFEQEHIIDVEDVAFDKLFALSGGNPLYTYEIGKALMDKFKAQGGGAFDIGTRSSKASTGFSRLVQDFKIDRIEEVVYYRLDHCSDDCQRLLKLAAIISANGAHFSLPLLLAVDGGDMTWLTLGVDERSVVSLAKNPMVIAIIRLLKGREFIRMTAGPISLSSSKSSKSSPTAVSSISLSGSEKSKAMKEAEDYSLWELVTASYEFIIRMERDTIYSMMLKDQKESLHDRVAGCLQRLRLSSSRAIIPDSIENAGGGGAHRHFGSADYFSRNSSKQFFEEAYHWHLAKSWHNAMECYFRTAEALEDVGLIDDCFEYCRRALRMFSLMKQDLALSNFSYDDLVTPILSRDDTPQAAFLEVLENISLIHHSITRLQVRELLNGDPTLLDITLKTLLKFGQMGFSLLKMHPLGILRVYEEALQLITLTWNIPFVQRFQFQTRTLKDLAELNRRELESAITEAEDASKGLAVRAEQRNSLFAPMCIRFDIQKDTFTKSCESRDFEHSDIYLDSDEAICDPFFLRDPSITFPILSGMSTLFRFGGLPDDSAKSIEKSLYRLIVTLAQSDPKKYAIHCLQGLVLTANMQFDFGNQEEALSLVEAAIKLYDPLKHHKDLVRSYGNDRVAFTVVAALKKYMLRGEIANMHRLRNLAVLYFKETNHFHSTGVMLLYYNPVMLLTGQLEDAIIRFQTYLDWEYRRGEGYSFFKDTNQTIYLFLQLMNQWQLAEKSQDFSGFFDFIELRHNSSLLKTMLADIMKGNLFLTGEDVKRIKKVFVINVSFGISIECACANICLINAKLKQVQYSERKATGGTVDDQDHLTQLQQLVDTAAKYIHQGFRLSEGKRVLFMCRLLLYMVQAELLVFTSMHVSHLVSVAVSFNTAIPNNTDVSSSSSSSSSTSLVHYIPSQVSAAGNISLALESLTACATEATALGYTFAVLHIAVLLQRLNIDTALGRQYQQQAVEALMLSEDSVSYANNILPTLLTIFPSL